MWGTACFLSHSIQFSRGKPPRGAVPMVERAGERVSKTARKRPVVRSISGDSHAVPSPSGPGEFPMAGWRRGGLTRRKRTCGHQLADGCHPKIPSTDSLESRLQPIGLVAVKNVRLETVLQPSRGVCLTIDLLRGSRESVPDPWPDRLTKFNRSHRGGDGIQPPENK